MANEVEIVVTGRDNTGSIFSKIRTKISESIKAATRDADRDGKAVGSRVVSAIGSALKSGNKLITDSLNSVMTGSLKGALSTPIVGPIILAALAGAVTAIAPALAAAIGGALVLGFGAAFVGLGAMVLLENEKIKAQFTKTFDDVKNIMTRAFEPLKPVLDVVRKTIGGLAKEFAPFIKQAAEMAKGPLIEFVRNLGKAFGNLKPAIQPMMQAFTDIINTLGPALPGVFADIGAAIGEIGQVVSENKTLIAAMFLAVLQVIPLVLNAISGLISFFGDLTATALSVGASIARTFSDAASAVLGFVETMLNGLRTVADAVRNIPGMEGFADDLTKGLDDAIAKVGEWKKSAQDLAKGVELKANIAQLTTQIDKARAQLRDPELTKERRATLNADITKLEVAKAKAVRDLGDPKLIKEYKSQLTTNIDNLRARVAEARSKLRDPELTKERRSKLNAEISQLKAAVATAKAAIASVQGKTVTVFVKTEYQSDLSRAALRSATARAHGGIVGAQGGGPRSNMTLVGEQGPELVKLPFGSTVVSNDQTRGLVQRGAVGGPSGEGLTVNLYVQGSIRSDRDLVKIIRDEFVNGGFRGALTNV